MKQEFDVHHATLYRAYRPHRFAEVRGQEPIVKALEGAIKNKRIAHAYLFSGGRGTGKTSVARILARELGVSEKDLYEIDAASNTGVEHVRELREGVYAMPFESPYKFYIIDEAHMLSRAAWNALLKTLEEPPAHVIFVLATTEREKVPDTIQSRCETYQFTQPNREILAQIITDVAKSEGFSIEPAAAELIALLADSSFRDALSVLQKVLAVAPGKKVDLSAAETITGAPPSTLIRDLVAALAKKDTSAALLAVRSAVDSNIDMRVFLKLLILRLRVVLLLRFAPDLAETFKNEVSAADVELAQSLIKEAAITSETLRLMLEAYGQTAYAAVPHLPLELAIVDIASKGAGDRPQSTRSGK